MQVRKTAGKSRLTAEEELEILIERKRYENQVLLKLIQYFRGMKDGDGEGTDQKANRDNAKREGPGNAPELSWSW